VRRRRPCSSQRARSASWSRSPAMSRLLPATRGFWSMAAIGLRKSRRSTSFAIPRMLNWWRGLRAENKGWTMPSDPLLERIVPALADVAGVEAVVLGGSRARETAPDASNYDIGLYFSADKPLDTDRLLQVAKTMVDNP